MKRSVTVLVAAAVLCTGQVAGAAPSVPTTLYMHGPSAAGEVDGVQWLSELTFPRESPLVMDAVKPTSGQGKSMSYVSAVNDQCTGVPLYPTFVAKLSGTIAGPITLEVHSLSAPATYEVQVWTDTEIFSCNAEYVPPAVRADVTVPAGASKVEVVLPVLPKRRRNVRETLTVMVLAPQAPAYEGQVGRLQYDAAATPSGVRFLCTPRKGARACL